MKDWRNLDTQSRESNQFINAYKSKMSIILLEMSPVLGTKNVKIVRIIMKNENILSHGSDASFETIYEVDSASLTGVISCSAQVSKIAAHRQNPILVFFTS